MTREANETTAACEEPSGERPIGLVGEFQNLLEHCRGLPPGLADRNFASQRISEDLPRLEPGLTPGTFRVANPQIPAFDFNRDGTITYRVQSGANWQEVAIHALTLKWGNLGSIYTQTEMDRTIQELQEANPDHNRQNLAFSADRPLNIPLRFYERMTARPRREFTHPDHPGISIQIAGASSEFGKEVLEHFSRLPPEMRQRVSQNNDVLVVGDLRDVDPRLATMRPRGHKDGIRWNNLDGMYIPPRAPGQRGTIVVAESSINPSHRQIVRTDSDRTEFLLHHEFGHGLDATLGGFSSTIAYMNAFKADYASMPASRKVMENNYFAEGAYAGFRTPKALGRMSEVFAQLNQLITGHYANLPDEQAQRFVNDFRNCFELQVEHLLRNQMLRRSDLVHLAERGYLTGAHITRLESIHRDPKITANLHRRMAGWHAHWTSM